MYILEKYSSPGFKLEADDISWVRWMLEENVCGSCKWTQAQYKAYASENPTEVDEEDPYMEEHREEMVSRGINPTTFSDFFPENYSSLSDSEMINLLLDTACGCAFGFEETQNA